MADFHVNIGDSASHTTTASESDVLQFAEITGDHSPNHVDKEFMEKSTYGRPIAHGALIVGYMSNASTKIVENCPDDREFPVSLGYDRIRFIKPVYIGDTVTIVYTIAEIDRAKKRSVGEIEVTNQDGDLVAVASHILQWVSKA